MSRLLILHPEQTVLRVPFANGADSSAAISLQGIGIPYHFTPDVVTRRPADCQHEVLVIRRAAVAALRAGYGRNPGVGAFTVRAETAHGVWTGWAASLTLADNGDLTVAEFRHLEYGGAWNAFRAGTGFSFDLPGGWEDDVEITSTLGRFTRLDEYLAARAAAKLGAESVPA